MDKAPEVWYTIRGYYFFIFRRLIKFYSLNSCCFLTRSTRRRSLLLLLSELKVGWAWPTEIGAATPGSSRSGRRNLHTKKEGICPPIAEELQMYRSASCYGYSLLTRSISIWCSCTIVLLILFFCTHLPS